MCIRDSNTVIAHEGKEFVGTIEESTDDPVATGEKTDDTLDYFKKLAEQDWLEKGECNALPFFI